jgi:hypothetical protein
MNRWVLSALGVAAVLVASGPARAQTATPQVVNGLPTSDFPTTGALLWGSDPDTASSICSGTLIGCETFLTAAHCVCDFDGAECTGPSPPDPADFLVFLQHGGFFAISSIALRSDYDFPVADVAVLKLAAPVSGIPPTPINATSTPAFGTPGTIAGFGNSGDRNDDFGLKRFGAVVTQSCTAGLSNTTSVCWSFEDPVGPPGDDSNTCDGDSGGPLFIDLGAGDSVAGVTSGGESSDCLPPDEAFDTNVFFYRGWIGTQGGADLSNTECGALAQVGDPEVTVHGFSGSVSHQDPEGRHGFDVPAGVTLLRVSMNASEERGNDFDLYVKAGSPPTPSDFDCRAFGVNQWGFCEFASPAATSWHVLINRFSGGGEYQATATVFPAPGGLGPCEDGLDNDLDGLYDWDGAGLGPPDPGCKNASWPAEDPECSDGDDNDGDLLIDWDGAGQTAPDPECNGRPHRRSESPPSCGLGLELAPLLLLLAWLRRRSRRVLG